MRYPLLSLTVLALFAGCVRDDAAQLPDRGDHAYVMPGARTATAASGGGDSAPLVSDAPGPEAGETTVVFRPGDRLYRIADAHGVELQWLIRRNDLVEHPPRTGTELIVPQR